jgi:hypothetical protein
MLPGFWLSVLREKLNMGVVSEELHARHHEKGGHWDLDMRSARREDSLRQRRRELPVDGVLR